jgi:error-prone DNA polymerase
VDWARHRKVARESSALIVRGRLERANGVTNLVAEHLETTPPRGAHDLQRLQMSL